jgi:Nucleotide-diphospho-sugar transferase
MIAVNPAFLQTEIEIRTHLTTNIDASDRPRSAEELGSGGRDPGGGDAQWGRSCSPTPWLLSKGSDLPYSGLHNNLEELATVQARDIDGHKAVSVVFFNYHQSVMMQNAVYSLVKWSGVCNYIVAVWDEPSLEACIGMNLPCFDASAMTPGNDTIGADREARLHSDDYVKITWMKPILVSALLDLGFLVHASDVDVAYSPGDLTRSYLNYILEGNATAAFQRESKLPFIVNTGNYMVLPNDQGKSFLKAWLGRADAAIAAGDHEQTALGELYHEKSTTPAFYSCATPQECKDAYRKSLHTSPPTPIVRKTSNSWFLAFGNTCITKEPHRMFAVHPCSFPTLYFHSVCVIGSAAKIRALKGAGFWFLDDGDDSKGCPLDIENPNIVRCRPLAERIPEIEQDFLTCDPTRLAFSYYQKMNPGAAAVDPAVYNTSSSSTGSSASALSKKPQQSIT